MKINVGTIGHVDHGKATLSEMLSKALIEVVADASESLFARSDTARRYENKASRKARMRDLQRRAFLGQ